MNTPHGGTLVNLMLDGAERKKAVALAKGAVRLPLDAVALSDVELLAIGGYSPITGFLTKADYDSVLARARLADGTVWPIPITLSVDEPTAKRLKPGEVAALYAGGDESDPIALLQVAEVYPSRPQDEAQQVYRTSEAKHPGVARVLKQGPFLVGGRVSVITRPAHGDFAQYRLDPADTRRKFEALGWKTIVGFQTRNPVHRAHEYLQKCALELVDGLLLHPLVGETKSDDIPADVRMRCYEALLAG